MGGFRNDQDEAFAEIALLQSYATKAQIEECLKAQEEMANLGIEKDLVSVMLDKNLITMTQAETVRRAAENKGRIRLLGGFEVLEDLGKGAMGAVYKARQLSLDRMVALKILNQDLGSNEDFIARFRREARAAAKLNHVNVVQCYEVGEENGVHYMAMEYVEGETVGSILKNQGRMEEQEVIGVCLQIARALQHAHESGIVHRDVKPENLLYVPPTPAKSQLRGICGLAKLADLGLARIEEPEAAQLTKTGTAVGTPHYIAPEQAKGDRDLDIRADIYALGATMFHMLTGQPPYDETSATAVILAHISKPLPDPRQFAPVSESTCEILQRAMKKEPAERYQTPLEMENDLEKALAAWAEAGFRTGVMEVAVAAAAAPETDAATAEEKSPTEVVPTGAEPGSTPAGGSALKTLAKVSVLVLCVFLILLLSSIARKGKTKPDEQPVAQADTSQLPVSTGDPTTAGQGEPPAAVRPAGEPKPAMGVAAAAFGQHDALGSDPAPVPESSVPKVTPKPAPKPVETQPARPQPKPATTPPTPAPTTPKPTPHPPEPKKEVIRIPERFQPALDAFLAGDLDGVRKKISRLEIADAYSRHAEVLKCFTAMKEGYRNSRAGAAKEAETAFGQLAVHGGDAAVPMLVQLLKDKDPRIRRRVCELFAKMKQKETVTYLQKVAATDQDPEVRKVALKAYQELTGQSHSILDVLP